MSIHRTILVVAGLCLALVAQAPAFNMDFVHVGDAGNAGELSGLTSGGYGAWGPDRPNTGAVSYEYYMGTYEVTSGQYTEFLNAVAATDPYGLYNPEMAHNDYPGTGWYNDRGCHIERSGVDGSYTYAVTHDWDNRPVNWLSTGDAFRFINWMHNGQPTGAVDLTTTEDGAYYLNGINDNASLLAVTREGDAAYFLPTEDEWYKAAFYDPTLNGGAGGYYDFAMQTDNPTLIDNDILPVDPGFSANYKKIGNDASIFPHPGIADGVSFAVASDVGEFENSGSYYGTFDQSGNVSEIVHEVFKINYFLARGGNFQMSDLYLTAGDRWGDVTPTVDWPYYGFRVATLLPSTPGDFDDDGDIDSDDIGLLCANLTGAGNPAGDPMYDLDGDGDADQDDMDMLIHDLVQITGGDGTGTEYGDFDLDGDIDTTDLTILATNFGVGTTWLEGNANCDLVIDTTDLTIMATNFGFLASGAVPEPATMSLLAIGACLPLFRRKRL